MKLNDDLYILPIPGTLGGILNLCLILDPENGATLVDTALPDALPAIENAMAEAGLEVIDLEHIILTHQDVDHIGSLTAIKEESDANVLASMEETPYIQGEKRLIKATPERIKMFPPLKEVLDQIKPVKVDEYLADGQVLELAGGVRVIETPGHTPGHVSLFLERSKVLIAGDAMVSENGKLAGPRESATPDMDLANASVRKLATELPEISAIVCYHGGVVSDDPVGQLAAVAKATES